MASPRSLTLTLALLISVLLPVAAQPFSFFLLRSAHKPQALPPSPSPSPSPAPAPLPPPPPTGSVYLIPSCENSVPGCPQLRRYPPLMQTGGAAGSDPGNPQLNAGEKVGLAFLGVAVVLQVVFGGFLIFKRRQMRRLGVKLERVPSLPRGTVPPSTAA